MKILLSPAKKINENSNSNKGSSPVLLHRTSNIIKKMKSLSKEDIAKLMNLSPKLSLLNYDRFQNIENSIKNNAIFLFDGDVYTGLEINSFNNKELKKADETIRILSGLYGILKPMDLISPYRLEMGTKVSIENKKDLYHYWSNSVTQILKDSLLKKEIIVNLASNEYSKVVDFSNINNKVITPIFKDMKNGKYKIISFYAKKARGLMAKFIIKNNVVDYKGLTNFNLDGYKFNKELSTELNPVFTREDN